MKVLICTIAVLFAACSAAFIDVNFDHDRYVDGDEFKSSEFIQQQSIEYASARDGNSRVGGHQSNPASAFNSVHQRQPIVKELKVIEVVRQNDQPVSTVVKNIKVVHQTTTNQQPGTQAVKSIQIIHQPQQSTSNEVETVQVVHEQVDSSADHNVDTITVVNGNDGPVAAGDFSGGGFNGYFYGAASKNGYAGLSESSGGYSNVGNSAGYFYDGAFDGSYGDLSDGGYSSGSYDDTPGGVGVLEILQALKIIGALSLQDYTSTVGR